MLVKSVGFFFLLQRPQQKLHKGEKNKIKIYGIKYVKESLVWSQTSYEIFIVAFSVQCCDFMS